ncbi:DUF6247 family protein [Saccharothrix ecbatanensis]|uniref:DUF6247 family protein n=1 Tax=Saccharothrix ecbatanensis TaxID=1105145 RepID=UPI001C87CA15
MPELDEALAAITGRATTRRPNDISSYTRSEIDRTPEAIRAALLPEERDAFDADCRHALGQAVEHSDGGMSSRSLGTSRALCTVRSCSSCSRRAAPAVWDWRGSQHLASIYGAATTGWPVPGRPARRSGSCWSCRFVAASGGRVRCWPVRRSRSTATGRCPW